MAVAALAVLLGLSASGIPLAAVGFVAPGWISWLVVATFAINCLVVAIRTNSAPESAPQTLPLILLPHTRSERLEMILIFSPLPAIGEELVYRSFFLSLLLGIMSFWPANIIQSAIFGFHHGGFRQGWKSFLLHAIPGFIFGLLVRWHGNLVPAMVIHFLMNASTAARPPAVIAKAAAP